MAMQMTQTMGRHGLCNKEKKVRAELLYLTEGE